MKKTGELLKAKRESANLSLSEVALATKINPKVLQAIENGESEKLPAKTFLKGFVRSYALYLKADLQEIMRVFTEETGGPTPPTVHEAYQKTDGASTPRRGPPDEESSSGLRTALILVIALLIGAIIGVRELIEKYQKEKVVTAGEVKVSPLPEGSPAAEAAKVADAVSAAVNLPKSDSPLAVVAEAEKEVSHPTKGAASVDAAKSNAKSDAKSNAKSDVKAEGKADAKTKSDSKLKVEAKPKAEAKPVAEAASVMPVMPVIPSTPIITAAIEKANDGAAAADTSEAAKPASPKSARYEIILEAKDKVDVTFKVHGETKHLSMGPDDVHTIRSENPVALEVSDGGALTLIINGSERGLAGAAGQPAHVQLP